MSKKIFAIGLKGWVELRESSDSPKPLETKVVKTTTVEEYDFSKPPFMDPQTGHYTYPKVKRKKQLTLKSVSFAGGRRIGVIKSRQFRDLTKLSIGVGGIVELDPEIVPRLIEKSWQSKVG